MRAQLGVAVGDEARLNVCELGVAVGLPRRTIKECLLEGVSLEDAAQLEALVALFMEKTQDAERLLSRVAEVDIRSKFEECLTCHIVLILTRTNSFIFHNRLYFLSTV